MKMQQALALAETVSLGALDRYEGLTACVAWIESADRRCGKVRSDGLLCSRHHAIAEKRHAKLTERKADQKARFEAEREARRPERERRLAAIDAEIARRDPAPLTTDTAAFGGVGCSTVARQNKRRMSDANVQRMAELWRERDELVALLGVGRA